MREMLIPALLLAAAAAPAQEPGAAKTDAKADTWKTPRIAVIDMARVSAESLLGKSYAIQLESLENEIKAEGTKKQAELQKLDAQIKLLQDELEKQGSVLSPEAADKKRQEVVKKSRDRQGFLEDGQAEIQRLQEQARQKAQVLNNEFQQRIRPQIEAAAKEKGIDILLDSQVALTVSKTYDISQDVIVKADDIERAAKAKAGAAKAPAAKAPATPSPQP